MKPFIVHRDCLQKDSWTSGDYVQYIAYVDNRKAWTCRHSNSPLLFGALGFAILVAIGLLILNSPSDMIDWYGAIAVTIIAFMMIGPMVVETFTPWRWMVRLKPLTWRNGSYWRDYLDG